MTTANERAAGRIAGGYPTTINAHIGASPEERYDC